RRRPDPDARGHLGPEHVLAVHRPRRPATLRRRRARLDAPPAAAADRVPPAVAAAAPVAGTRRLDRHRLPRRRAPLRDRALAALVGRSHPSGAGHRRRGGARLCRTAGQDRRMTRFRAGTRGRPGRVLVHTGTLDLCNVGDAAMLQTAVTRLAAQWPDASIAVITGRESALRRLCPGALPVPADAMREWSADRYLFGSLESHIPQSARTPLA